MTANWTPPSREQLLRVTDLAVLMADAASLRDAGKGDSLTYSRKVFIPLTELCRDVCHYCTYAKTPRRLQRPYLTPDQVLAIARSGRRAGCREALFTLGDKPELRYRAARDALEELGYGSTLEYLGAMARLVLEETGLLPHLNPGVMSREDYLGLRPAAPSMGIMLESASPRLADKGGPHFGSPDKQPDTRLAAIEAAGQAGVALTSGLLIGIGDTREERVDSLLALRRLHEEHGHIQEIILQNFVPKPATKMAGVPPPGPEELPWTIAVTRLIFGPRMNIQAPPNLNAGRLATLVDAGINDWGGVSPVTPDHVNPELPWPQLAALAEETRAAGKRLTERLTIYPEYLADNSRWIDPTLMPHVLRHCDGGGLARENDWAAGISPEPPVAATVRGPRLAAPGFHALLDRAEIGEQLSETEVTRLFDARGDEVLEVIDRADALRQRVNGDTVTFVVTRNINYTNLCRYKCRFCAFSKGKASDDLRGAPYVLSLAEIERRTAEAWTRGATEVCLQGGIHPEFTGQTYLDICRAVKNAAPDIHVHAFSALEVSHGAETLGIPVADFLEQLQAAGLSSLPGTAAEILDDEVRREICPDKLMTREWLDVVRTAHEVGLRTTSTIMFGHRERPVHWARHLLALRDLQADTGGVSEFVPLPFVHSEAPMFRRGQARPGPTWREALLMHAVARLVLHPLITNIQASWVKLGAEGAHRILRAGVNDLGGTLMNESISRAAGASHGQELSPESMEQLIVNAGRLPRQRTTLYGIPGEERMQAGRAAAALKPLHFQPAKEYRAAS